MPTGKVYIGSALNMYRRWHARHLPQLRQNNHCNRYLQAAWNKYGEVAFTCEVVEQCSSAALVDREQHWMDEFKNVGLFNLAKKAGSTLGVPQSVRCKLAILKSKCKTYIVTDPAGNEQTITNLKEFCTHSGLTSTAMNRVAVGKAKHHRQWECRPAVMTRSEWLAIVTDLQQRPIKTMHGKVWCSKCRDYKLASEFNQDSHQPSGFAAYCRGCHRKRMATQYRKRRAA